MDGVGKWKSIQEIEEDYLLRMVNPQSFLPINISQLLPENNEKNFQTTFVAIGPMLIDSLASGDSLVDACAKAHISPDRAIKLLAAPQFLRFVESYLAIGDLKDRDARIRLSKAILASQIASGIVSKRKEPLDILDYIRKEHEAKKGSSNVYVQVLNNSVPRPYALKNAEVSREEGSS